MPAYTSYSVGAFTHTGREIGREFSTYEKAQAYVKSIQHFESIASASIFGWTDDFDCVELSAWISDASVAR